MEVKFNRSEIRLLDAITIDKIGIPGIVLMENAAIQTYNEIMKMLPNAEDSVVSVVCGKGNNGGDGYAIARHLFNNKVYVKVFGLNAKHFLNERVMSKDDRDTNLDILYNLNVGVTEIGTDISLEALHKELESSDLIVDALLGTGTQGNIREPMDKLIESINSIDKPVVSVDIPSGLDCDKGIVLGKCVKATKTVTFAAPKIGFFENEGPKHVGELVIVDISIPKKLIRDLYLKHHPDKIADEIEDYVEESVEEYNKSQGKSE